MLTPPLLTVSSRAVRPAPALEAIARLEAAALQLEGPERALLLARAAVLRARQARVRFIDAFLFARVSRRAPGGSVGQAIGWLTTAGEVRRELAGHKATYRALTGVPMPSPALPPAEPAVVSQDLATPDWGARVTLGGAA